ALTSLSGAATDTATANTQKALTSLSGAATDTATANTQKALTSLAVGEQDIFAPFGRSIGPAHRLHERERGSPFQSARSLEISISG
ncbi:MAG: hypothetical protein V5A43_11105, partial [Haloarculaceae archaeon]